MAVRESTGPGAEARAAFDLKKREFIDLVRYAAKFRPLAIFRCCSNTGEDEPLVQEWGTDGFKTRFSGTIEDAARYLHFRIGQGFHVAVGLPALRDTEAEIWLTAWERPQTGPVWPAHVKNLIVCYWEGFSKGEIVG